MQSGDDFILGLDESRALRPVCRPYGPEAGPGSLTCAFSLEPCTYILGRLHLAPLQDFSPGADDDVFHWNRDTGKRHTFFDNHGKC